MPIIFKKTRRHFTKKNVRRPVLQFIVSWTKITLLNLRQIKGKLDFRSFFAFLLHSPISIFNILALKRQIQQQCTAKH